MWPFSVSGRRKPGQQVRDRRAGRKTKCLGSDVGTHASRPSTLQETRCHRELWPSLLLGSGIAKTRLAVPSGHPTLLSFHLWANPGAQNSFVLKGLFTLCQGHPSGSGRVAWLHVILTFARCPSCTCGRPGAAVRACEKKPGDVGGQRDCLLSRPPLRESQNPPAVQPVPNLARGWGVSSVGNSWKLFIMPGG